MRPKRPWYREPLWWMTILIGWPLVAIAALILLAMADRSPPVIYERLEAGAFDPATRILSLQWVVTRRRYCPGELIRTVEGQVGGIIQLPTVIIDAEVDPPELRASRVGTTYVSRTSLIQIPATLGGTIKLTTVPRNWCWPFQQFVPIESSTPPISFQMPDLKAWTSGSLPVTVGPVQE